MGLQTLSFGSQEADGWLNRLVSTSQRVSVMNFGFDGVWSPMMSLLDQSVSVT